ncbi:mitochondrial 37S ribosomal protein mS42 [Ascoidea rubescens DSM 1968]|uniref:Mitochondrial ribosomal protein, small subunit n=1 Tax=Ascoidea rubescens DSM 1968 TaxID=1344418 RepID=A0A1D2VD52_9ASCO|nr:mitochondrial ribosomal protein, small subunit [Ascoidea rubescens DSM 1968]ODV59628.1 mitochondrial ribosomal protein, small subunit [Ascoidea rubescens DSM 1968]
MLIQRLSPFKRLLLSFKTSTSRIFAIQSRNIHLVPDLPNRNQWFKNGIPKLYSKRGFEIAWKDYQTFLTMNLSMLTAQTHYEFKTPLKIILTASKDSLDSEIFHYASQAFNNHFFFTQLLQDSNETTRSKNLPSRFFLKKLKENSNFNSIEDLKSQIIQIAKNNLGNGWIYLIEDKNKSLNLYFLNNDGTPFLKKRFQNFNLSGPINIHQFQDYENLKISNTENHSSDFDHVLPVLSISLWDYSYLYDYGLNGREDYINSLWNLIDWSLIDSRLFKPL